MGGNPGADVGEVFFCCANVEEVTGGVAIGDGVCGGVVVGFACEETDAVVQLVEDPELLVGGCVVGGYEGAVVGPNVGYVAVLSEAEFGIVIACLGVCWDDRGGGCSADC